MHQRDIYAIMSFFICHLSAYFVSPRGIIKSILITFLFGHREEYLWGSTSREVGEVFLESCWFRCESLREEPGRESEQESVTCPRASKTAAHLGKFLHVNQWLSECVCTFRWGLNIPHHARCIGVLRQSCDAGFSGGWAGWIYCVVLRRGTRLLLHTWGLIPSNSRPPWHPWFERQTKKLTKTNSSNLWQDAPTLCSPVCDQWRWV